MDIKKILGENIRNYRKKENLNQEELAEKLNISSKHLSNIEIGKKFVTSELLENISKVLNVSPSALFYSSEINKQDDNMMGKIDKIINTETNQFMKRLKEKIREEK